jgi:hypothetical protein
VVEAGRHVEPDSVPGVLDPLDCPAFGRVLAHECLERHPEEPQREGQTPDPPHLLHIAGEELIERSIDPCQRAAL